MDDCFAYRAEAREEAIDWEPARPIKPAIQPVGFSDDRVPRYRAEFGEPFRSLTDGDWQNFSDADYFEWWDAVYARHEPDYECSFSRERLTTASAKDVAACGVTLGPDDVALRFAYRPALVPPSMEKYMREWGAPPSPNDIEPVDPSGTIHVALLILRKPDEDPEDPQYDFPLENYVVYIHNSLDDRDGWLALMGVYEEGRSQEPIRLAGLRRCFRFIDWRWVDRSYYACTPLPPEPPRGGSARNSYPEFDRLFQKAAGGKSIASLESVRGLFMDKRSGTAEAKRAAWSRALAKARVCGYEVSVGIISKR